MDLGHLGAGTLALIDGLISAKAARFYFWLLGVWYTLDVLAYFISHCELPGIKKTLDAGERALIVDIPRYQEFTTIAQELAQRYVRFLEVAGNPQITVSVLALEGWRYGHPGAQELFSSPILTHPGQKRVLMGCDVAALHTVLRTLRADGVVVEHVYDF